jgi:proteasome lid subunit RPN8/RPN11
VGEAAHQARSRRLVLLAQVHTHPGDDTRHSDADDNLVLMAREAMFSIVVARYGNGGLTLAEGAGIHQFQDGRWIQVSDGDNAIIAVPTVVHT